MNTREQALVDAQRAKTNATPIPSYIPHMTSAEALSAMEKEAQDTEAEWGGSQLSPEDYLKLLEAREMQVKNPTLRKEYVAEELKDLFSQPPMEIAVTISNLIESKTVVELHLVVGEPPRIVFMADSDGQFITPDYLEEGKRIAAEGKD